MSLTLQNRLSKQSLADNEPVLNQVDTGYATEEQKGIDNPVYEENKSVQNQEAVDCISGEEKEKDVTGIEEKTSNHLINDPFSGEQTGIDNPVYEVDDRSTDEEDDNNSEAELKVSGSNENEFTESNINEVNQEDVDPHETATNGLDETVPKDMDDELENKGTNDTHNMERKYVTTIQISPSSFTASE